MSTLVEKLSSYAGALRYEDLPADVIVRAKRFIVDSIGCALGAADSEPVRIAREIAGSVQSTSPATVMVSGERTSPDLATFVNGIMIRFLDFNDGYTSTGESGHPSDSIAAVLTVGELMRRGGKDVITATVLGYEVFCRICDEVDLKPLGWDHVTIGCIASTAAAAKLWGLPDRQIAEAFNLGIAPNIALWQTRKGGTLSMWKGCAYANASRNAVFAAMLAARGMTGPSPVFEGIGGYFKAVTRKPFELAALGGAKHTYKILECSIKRFALGQYSQTIVQAALDIRDKIGNTDDIAEVRIETVTVAILLMAGESEWWAPTTRETADHSMPYVAALSLLYGTIQEEHFDHAHRQDPRILGLTKRIKIEASAEADRRMPGAMLCNMTIIMKDGKKHVAVVEHHKGHWKNPMSDAEVEAKFRALSGKVMKPAQSDRLLDALCNMENQEDVGAVMRLTVSA